MSPTHRTVEPRLRPIRPNLRPLLCSRVVRKPDKPLEVRMSLWATNPFFPAYKNSHIKRLQITIRLYVVTSHPNSDWESWSLLYVPLTELVWKRCFVSRAVGSFHHSIIHSFVHISRSPQLRSSPKLHDENSHRPRSPMRTEGQRVQWGCRLVPQGDRLWHCCYHLSSMQPSARYLPLWRE